MDEIEHYMVRVSKLSKENQRLKGLLERCGEKLVMIDNLMPELMLEDLIVDIAKEFFDED